MPARVLLIGTLQAELDARAAILEHFWRTATAEVPGNGSPDLQADVIVVCETLPEPSRQQWVERLRHQLPASIVVKMNSHDSGPYAGADAIVNQEHGPGALVSKIYELLTERGLGSRAWPIVAQAHRLT